MKRKVTCNSCGHTKIVEVQQDIFEKYSDGWVYKYQQTGEYRPPSWDELYLDNHGNVLSRGSYEVGSSVIVKYLGREVSID